MLSLFYFFRTKVKSIQLVSLVLSRHWKEYGNYKCNQRLIQDLKELEENGLEVEKPVKSTVKAGLYCIVGDNLGQGHYYSFKVMYIIIQNIDA